MDSDIATAFVSGALVGPVVVGILVIVALGIKERLASTRKAWEECLEWQRQSADAYNRLYLLSRELQDHGLQAEWQTRGDEYKVGHQDRWYVHLKRIREALGVQP